MGTHRIEDDMLASKTKGTFAHHDFSAEYEEDGKYKGLRYGAFIETFSLLKTHCDFHHLHTPFVMVHLFFCFQRMGKKSAPRYQKPSIH